MKKANYIAELTFLGVLVLIDVAFITQLLETQNDPMQIVDAVEYARVIIALLTVGLIAVILETIMQFSKYLKTHPNETGSKEKTAESSFVWKLVAASAVLFFFYCFFIDKLGYYTSGLIVLVLYQLILYRAQIGKLDKKALLKIALISIATVVILYLIFSVAFELYLPRGILR